MEAFCDEVQLEIYDIDVDDTASEAVPVAKPRPEVSLESPRDFASKSRISLLSSRTESSSETFQDEISIESSDIVWEEPAMTVATATVDVEPVEMTFSIPVVAKLLPEQAIVEKAADEVDTVETAEKQPIRKVSRALFLSLIHI